MTMLSLNYIWIDEAQFLQDWRDPGPGPLRPLVAALALAGLATSTFQLPQGPKS